MRGVYLVVVHVAQALPQLCFDIWDVSTGGATHAVVEQVGPGFESWVSSSLSSSPPMEQVGCEEVVLVRCPPPSLLLPDRPLALSCPLLVDETCADSSPSLECRDFRGTCISGSGTARPGSHRSAAPGRMSPGSG